MTRARLVNQESLPVVAEVTELSGPQLARLLGLSAPAYERRGLKNEFSRTQRTKLARVVNVVERAQRVLGDRGRAQQWLIHPNRALGSSTPLMLLETRDGTQRVITFWRASKRARSRDYELVVAFSDQQANPRGHVQSECGSLLSSTTYGTTSICCHSQMTSASGAQRGHRGSNCRTFQKSQCGCPDGTPAGRFDGRIWMAKAMVLDPTDLRLRGSRDPVDRPSRPPAQTHIEAEEVDVRSLANVSRESAS